MTFSRFVGKVKETAQAAVEVTQETAREVRESASEAWDAGREKLNGTLEALLKEVNGLKPILADCGFIVGDLNVTFTIPPEIKMTVDHIGKGTTTLEQILEEAQETLTALQKMVIKSMIKANELAHITRRYGYTFCKYDIALSLPPKVTVHLIADKAIDY